ncbi:Mrp/NBP35 family ATP-binding protein [Prauserella muralis]|uniref:Iron-sulfur cluster carrier protein n=1 Tax=Prauserella muralis TaxID=588067 RepID=A0A2V4APA8_9PSEU|nr:P-loop NTPase [Prauserella muralis]PXY22179.1 sodium:proton antiporter [Prauserella muralis]TWE27785.1 ATP-binding protein involved in chromosome partitioning [Prauserella muralis]
MLTRSRGRSAVDDTALWNAVGAVEDPELHRGIGELGMLRTARGDRAGTARVEVALTTAGCPLREHLREAVTAAALTVPGVRRAEVAFTTLSARQRMELAQRLRGERSTRFGARTLVYAVASGKGGVGKSSVAANLAVALARRGKRVGLLDADVWGYSVPQLFGVRRNPVALNGLMLPLQAHGVRLMSVGFLVADDAPVLWRGPLLHKALEQFLADVHWGELDVLLLDLPPGTGDITLSLLELVPEAALLAVTTPQPAAQAVASRVGRLARQQRMPVAGVVENMSTLVCAGCGEHTAPFGAGGGQRLADELGTELLGRIPLDAALREAGDTGLPVVAGDANAPSAVALTELAARLPAVRRGLAGLALPLTVVR